MVTVTTVGYGDLTPSEDPAHLMFVAAYAFLGVAIIASLLSDVSTRAVRFVKKMAREAKNEALMESNVLLHSERGAHYLHMHSSHEINVETAAAAAKAREKRRASLLGKSQKKAKRLYDSAKASFGVLVDLGVVLFQLFVIWACGAAMLQSTEGFTFVQGFYCCVITSISVGYGDYFPTSQLGRLLFSFYIPLSVTAVLGCIHHLMNISVQLQTAYVTKREPMTKIFSSNSQHTNSDGDGEISKAEYVLFMLQEMREIDDTLVGVLESQFNELDVDGSGALTAEDFPDSLEVETTTVVYKKQIERVDWKVVPKRDYHPAVRPTKQLTHQQQHKQPEPAPKPVSPTSTLVNLHFERNNEEIGMRILEGMPGGNLPRFMV
jgi:hypothetical protein